MSRSTPCGTHDDVDVAAGAGAGAQAGVDGRALDVEDVDTDRLGESLHRGMGELDPHRGGDDDGLGHAVTLGAGFARPPVLRRCRGIKSVDRTAWTCPHREDPL